MSLTDDIKKSLENEHVGCVAENKNKIQFEEGNTSNMECKKKKLSTIYGTCAKTLEIRSQLEKIIDMVNHTDPDFISIDIKVKTLTSKQRYRHKGSRVKISFFE